MKEIQHPTNRLRELLCVLFGHQWDAYGSESEGERVVEEFNQCSNCKLVKRIIWLPVEEPNCSARRAIAY